MGRWIKKNKTEPIAPTTGIRRGEKSVVSRTTTAREKDVTRQKANASFNTFPGSVKCPACGAVTTSQEALGRHILRKRDERHDALKAEVKKQTKIVG
jgi:hypothetical protein